MRGDFSRLLALIGEYDLLDARCQRAVASGTLKADIDDIRTRRSNVALEIGGIRMNWIKAFRYDPIVYLGIKGMPDLTPVDLT